MACAVLCSSDFNDLCRLCAAKTSVLLGLHIFDREGDARQICKKIHECLPVEVTSTDRLPKMVCEECVYKLDLLFEFREKSLKTESYLESILKTSESIIQGPGELSQAKGVEQVICENVGASIHDSLPLNVNLADALSVNDATISQDALHSSVQATLNASVDVMVPETVLGVVTDTLREELENNVNEMLTDSIVESVTESIGERCSEDAVSQVICNDDSQNSQPTSSSRIKCEPDIFIKDEDWVSDSSDSESEQDDKNGNKTMPKSPNAQEAGMEAGPEPSNKPLTVNGHSTESLVLPEETPSVFMNPAANSLLMLSCPQASETNDEVQWLFCNICGKAFMKNEEFQAHYESHCSKCTICGALFTNNDTLAAHFTEVHPLPDMLPVEATKIEEGATCVAGVGAAGVGTKTPSRRKKWEPKVCTECGKQYRTNYKLTEHMRKHTGEKPFQCSMCPKAFRSKIGLAQHEAKHTGQFDYTCSTCGKGFQCKSYLIVHQRVHSDVKPYPCTTCGRNFKTKQALLDHQNRHLGVKPYLCETCGRRFITKGLCKSHQRVHSGTDNKQYPCSVCNKLFVSKSYLTTHLRIHTGEKPFMCEVCGKGFLTRVDLRIHSTMHTGEKSFVCEWCGKAFARRDALRCHRRSHTGERPYSCDICGQSFTQFSPLTIHKRLHTGERPYACDICSKAFVSRSTMMSHRKKHTT